MAIRNFMKCNSRAALFVAFSCAIFSGDTKSGQPQEEKANQISELASRAKPPTPAILAAFDRYEIVGMSAAHGNKDLDDLILQLLRDPNFLTKVDDVVVECGNSLYQPVLDRYIAGESVSLTEARAVWRNTTQPMCSVSGFYEMVFPLIRRINMKGPPARSCECWR